MPTQCAMLEEKAERQQIKRSDFTTLKMFMFHHEVLCYLSSNASTFLKPPYGIRHDYNFKAKAIHTPLIRKQVTLVAVSGGGP